MISWKGFWATVTATVTGALACLAQLLGVSPWVAVGAQLVAGALFALVGSVVVHESPMFAAVPAHGRAQIMRLLRVGVAAHLVWAVAFVIRPDMWAVWLVTLATMAVVGYWTARGHEYLLTQIGLRPIPTTTGTTETGAGTTDGPDGSEDQYTRVVKAALALAGHGHLEVLRWEPVGSPAYGLRVWVRLPPRMVLAAAGARGGDGVLTQAAAEPIAIALGSVLRRDVLSDWVLINKEPAAGTYTILIVTEDVMARIYPYHDTNLITSIEDPQLVGYGMDGSPVHLKLAQHGQLSGKSTSGKSGLLNVEWAHVTRTSDALIWAAGVEKLYDLVGGWLEPYTDTDLPLPIDWVASGQTDLLTMLVAAMSVARWRQRQPMHTRRGFITIIVYLDEASFALRNNKAKALYQGVAYTASQLVGMLTQGAASGKVYIRFVSQRSTNDHFGDKGGDTTANAGFAAAFASRDQADAGRLTGSWKLPTPRHPGVYWLDAGDGPRLVKAPYLQSVDPSKPVLHDGVNVSTVAWSRRDNPRALDPGSATAAGDTYRGRHTRMGPDMLAYLTGDDAEADTAAGLEWTEGYQRAMDGLEAAGLGTPRTPDSTPSPAAVDGDVGQVSTMVGRSSRAARIVTIVEQAGTPLSPSAIRAALAATGDHAPDNVLNNTLARLVNEGRISRPERGLYSNG